RGSYRRWSGLGLVLFLAYQWYFPMLRLRGRLAGTARAYRAHKRVGALAPLVYYAHTATLRYGFVMFLSAVFLGNVTLGLANPDGIADPVRKRRYASTWLIVHVALSVVTVALMLLHVYVALTYAS